MTLEQMLSWCIGLSCVLMMFASLRNSGIKSLWFWKSLILLGLCLVSIFSLVPGIFPLLVGAWLILLMIPILGFNQLQRQVSQGKYQSAQTFAQVMKYLHPGDGWPEYPDILQALVLVQAGKNDLAATILKRYQQSPSPLAIHAMIALFRIERRWQDCINWIEALPRSLHWQTSPALITAYARSLGELQQYERFFLVVEANLKNLQKRPKEFSQLTLMALAFGGQLQQLHEYLGQPTNQYLAETQSYWLGTAAMTAGRMDIAQTQFNQLASQTQDLALKQAVKQRLRSPLGPTQKYLSETVRLGFQNLEFCNSAQLSRYDFGQQNIGQFWVTWMFLAANLAMFGVEVVKGGTENHLVLYKLGGLWPADVWAGQYWRLITVNFLHSGALHLAMNMMGLLILGPFIERVLGWFKFFVIYSISGLGAAIGIAYAPLWFGTQPEFTVGASGAIMGLVGAIAAVTLWGWLVERVSIAAKRFKTVMFMIGIQIAFDFSTPQISTTGHLSGLVVGFVVTLLVIGLFGFKEPSNRSLA